MLAAPVAINQGFGASLATDGNWMIVGAPDWYYNASVYIYEQVAGNWLFRQTLPDPPPGGWQYGASVAISGDTAITGEYRADNEKGKVWVYTRDPLLNSWGNPLYLTQPARNDHPQFGYAVSISGNWILIGAPNEYVNGPGRGRVYLFEKSNGAWVFRKRMGNEDGTIANCFGAAVSIYGNHAVVGAPGFSFNDPERAYILEYSNGDWKVAGTLSSGKTGDINFGGSVDIGNGWAIVGACNEHVQVDGSGAAYLYYVPSDTGPEVDDDNDGTTENQGDCNDHDSTIRPDAPEICGDGIDQDCNGQDLSCIP